MAYTRLSAPIMLYFYDNTGALQYVIDNFKAVNLHKSFAGVGEFRLQLVTGAGLDLATIKQCSFVSINNDVKKFCLIGDISEDFADGAHNVLITGTELKGIAEKRIVLNNTTLSNTYERIFYALLNNNIINPANTKRKLTPLTQLYDSTGGTWPSTTVEYDAKYGTLATELSTLAETYDFGWDAEAVLTNGALTGIKWIIKQGVNRTLEQTTNEPVILSFADNTVNDITYDSSLHNVPNTAIVAGKGEGAERIIRIVNDSNSGLNRTEKYVEARNLETSELNDKGTQELSQYGGDAISTVNPSAQLQNDFLAGVFAIGDICTVRDYNKTLRLTESCEIYEKNYCYCKLTFGLQTKTIASALSSLTANYANLVKSEGYEYVYNFTDIGTSATTKTLTIPIAKKIVKFDGCFYNENGTVIPLNSYHSTTYRSFLRFAKGTTYYTVIAYVGSGMGSTFTLRLNVSCE